MSADPGAPHLFGAEIPLIDAYALRDALGAVADGRVVDPRLHPVLRAALQGPVATADAGLRQYVVGFYAVALANVDTEEVIWPGAADALPAAPDVLLATVTTPALWAAAEAHWLATDAVAWTAFVWRIAHPLVRHLGIAPGWR